MKGITYVLLSQICFALIGVFTKYISPSVDTFTIVFFRVSIAAIFFLILAAATKNIRQLSLKREDIRPFFFLGVMVAFNFVFFIAAFSYTSIVEVGLLCSVTPIFVYLMASKVLKEKITSMGVVALAIVIVGIYLMNSTGFESSHLMGNIFVLLSCVFAAGQVTYTKLEERDHTSLDTVFWPMLVASIFMSPALVGFSFSSVPLNIYMWIVLLGVVATGFSYLFFAKALEHLEAGKYSIMSVIAFPLISIIFGVGLFGEHLTASMIYGGSLLMLSAVIVHYEKSPLLNAGFVRMMNQKLLRILLGLRLKKY
ncbi:EamA family transporter [archaeon]|nr:EamA family transporter [archaeon]